MSLRAKPTAIALFVGGAIALAVAAVMVLQRVDVFPKKEPYIVYFADSVNGLAAGSPVKFKGVPIGRVTDIKIRYNQGDETTAVPVFIELDISRMHADLGVGVDLSNPREFEEQIMGGLRATLEHENLQTDQAYVNLDYYNGEWVPPPIQRKPEFKEIPSLSQRANGMMNFALNHP